MGSHSFIRVLFALLLLALAGCDMLSAVKLPAAQTPTPGAAAGASSPQPGLKVTQTAGVSPALLTTTTAVPTLTLWVPPDFDPDSGLPAGLILRARLEEFTRQNGGVPVQVRVKAPSGPGGLLESLNAASAAAPLALPSVVALSRPDLEAAALKGLIFPLDGSSSVIDQADWYVYARQLAMVQGATFALPFAGDAMVVAYRPANVTGQFADWKAIYSLGQPLAFAAGDSQALFVLSLYQAIGGKVVDAQRRPMLEPDLLSQVLQVMADGEQRGVFPYWLSQYETSGQVWQAYRDGRVNALVTWVSNYLTNLPPDTTAASVPRLNDNSFAMATGWGWAVADPVPERRALSVKLVEFLSQGEFLAKWTEAAGYMPTRPSALAAWSNQSLKTFLSPVAVSSQARPTADQLVALGPVLKEATLKVLKRESDPTQAAKAASEKLTVPENR